MACLQELVVLVLDVGPSMPPHIELASHAAFSLVNSKVGVRGGANSSTLLLQTVCWS